MTSRHARLATSLLTLVTAASIGCGRDREQATTTSAPVEGARQSTGATGQPAGAAGKPTQEEAETALQEAAERDRERFANMTFEEFKASPAVYKEPFEGGKFIVNGDTPLLGEKQLREFFETRVRRAPQQRSMRRQVELAVGHVGGLDLAWNQAMQTELAYCVSRPGFGSRYDAVVRDMGVATQAWERVAAVKFRHASDQDVTCSATNQAVVFDVRPVNVNGQYLARAFFPNEPRRDRNVLIDGSSFELEPAGRLQLAGILRHELGHALGFRHEHTRPSAGPCFEDNEWRPLTQYDPFSVMHYPQCDGQGDWSLTLTPRDDNGAACLYGAATGFTMDPNLVDSILCRSSQVTPPDTGVARRQLFSSQSVAAGAQTPYGPFDVIAGSLFEAVMTGQGASGDPDLYVRFGSAPTTSTYNCRPYLATANETCAVETPAGQNRAFVMVHGYAAGSYTLEVKHRAPSQ